MVKKWCHKRINLTKKFKSFKQIKFKLYKDTKEDVNNVATHHVLGE